MPQSRLDKLRQQKEQLDARIKSIEAREREQTRRNETRRKIIAGALALHHAEKNPDDTFSKKLYRLLDEYVTKPYERKLFGLSVLQEDSQNNVANDLGNERFSLRDDFKS